MLHLLVEPGYRNGILMMKYAVNHPEKFRVFPKSDEKMKDKGIKRRVFFAFFMGFAQTTITLIVEILIILYLTSLKEHIEVIMKIVSLTVVV